jgi:hypothetical protein
VRLLLLVERTLARQRLPCERAEAEHAEEDGKAVLEEEAAHRSASSEADARIEDDQRDGQDDIGPEDTAHATRFALLAAEKTATVVCAFIVLGLAVVNLLAGLKYPPLLVNVVALGAFLVYIVQNLVRERRLR